MNTTRITIWQFLDFIEPPKEPPKRKVCWHCDGNGGFAKDIWTTIRGVDVIDREEWEPCEACGGTGLERGDE